MTWQNAIGTTTELMNNVKDQKLDRHSCQCIHEPILDGEFDWCVILDISCILTLSVLWQNKNNIVCMWVNCTSNILYSRQTCPSLCLERGHLIYWCHFHNTSLSLKKQKAAATSSLSSTLFCMWMVESEWLSSIIFIIGKYYCNKDVVYFSSHLSVLERMWHFFQLGKVTKFLIM